MLPISAEMGRLYDGLRQSKLLEKQAEELSGADADRLFQEKASNDYHTFELAKLAAGWGDAAKHFMTTPFGKGLGYAAGAAIPTMVAGNMIADHATEQARNKALEAGLGLAAVGGTLYGIHRMVSPKHATDEQAELEQALKKLASVGYLDELLSATLSDSETSDEARKLAAEVQALNREFGVSILTEMVG